MDAYVTEHLIDCKTIEKVSSGMMTFEYFLKVYKTAIIWNRVKFQTQKEDLISKRRKALKADDMTSFRQCMITYRDADEQCMQDVLEEILEAINVNVNEFNETLNLFIADGQKAPLIKTALEDGQIDKQEGVPVGERVSKDKPTMSLKEAIAAQKQLQDISIDQIKELRSMPPALMSDEVANLQFKLSDRFFDRTGIELEDLVHNSELLQIEKDEGYVQSMKEFDEKMGKLASGEEPTD